MRVQKGHVRYSKMRLKCSDPTEASERTDPSEAEEPLVEPGGSVDREECCSRGRESPSTPSEESDCLSRESACLLANGEEDDEDILYTGLDDDLIDTMSEKDRVDSNQNIPFVDDTDGEPDPEGITNEALDKSPTDQTGRKDVGPKSSQGIAEQAGSSGMQKARSQGSENETPVIDTANNNQQASGVSMENLPQTKEGDPEDPDAIATEASDEHGDQDAETVNFDFHVFLMPY